jgi:hypothetical protein
VVRSAAKAVGVPSLYVAPVLYLISGARDDNGVASSGLEYGSEAEGTAADKWRKEREPRCGLGEDRCGILLGAIPGSRSLSAACRKPLISV